MHWKMCRLFRSENLTASGLTLNVPSYLSLTRSISWLLMPWLLMSPGHQQPWYWLYRTWRSFSYLRKDLSTCVKSMWSNDIKCKYMFMFPLKNLACRGLKSSQVFLKCLSALHYPTSFLIACKLNLTVTLATCLTKPYSVAGKVSG